MSTSESPAIKWYRSPLTKEQVKSLHAKSDLLAAAQTLGYLGCILATGAFSLWAFFTGHWLLMVLGIFLHGTVCSFLINAVHELGHNTVFKTKWLNTFFCHVFAFPGWINHERFMTSHLRHHRYTLHYPDDQEVVLPFKIYRKNYFKTFLFNPMGIKWGIMDTWRLARGNFNTQWEEVIFPLDQPENRKATIRWARTLLIGHSAVLVISLWQGWYIVPILVLLPSTIGNWLFKLCNDTQHVGMQDHVPDFRRNCRTFLTNPVVQFLYWHMNYHIEHHMYAAVPCYRLGALHRAIKSDLPHCPRGFVETWKQIAAIQKVQETNPDYEYDPFVGLPTASAPAATAGAHAG